ncbi:autotransporter outer membrane beta-barrel domain-containing protein [Sutterella wadsworthensis]|uniref:autotransporter family protein n=2 Tax=Sutterella wadsworthensis TaxID=40545 RepID=UPI003078B592
MIKVNDDAHLYLLAEKQLSSDGKVLTSATSDTWSKGSVTVTGGEITVAEKGTLSVAHNDLVLKGGTISNAGTLQVNKLTIQGGKVANAGTLKADVLNVNSQIDSTAKGIESTIGTINLNKGGTLNLTSLNGNFAKGLGDKAPSDSDTTTIDNFVFVGGTMNIKGGAITVNGTTLKNMKVGTESSTAKVVVNSDFALDKIVLGAKGEVEVSDKFTVGNLYIFNGNSKITNNGTVVIGEVTLTDGDLGTSVFDNTNGTIYTKVGNVATLTNGTAATTTFGGLVKDEGKIYDNVTTGTMKLADMTAYKTAIGNLTFLKVTATDEKGNAPTFDAAAKVGLTSPATTVTAAATDNKVELDTSEGNVTVANVSTDAKDVTLTGGNSLTLAGSGTLFGDKVEAVNVKGATLVLGHEEFADAEGTVTGAVKLTDQGKFNVVAGSYKLGGLVTADENTTVNVNGGALATAYLTAGAQNVTVTDGILAVKGNEPQVVAPADANDSFKNAVSIEGAKFEQVQQGSTNTGVIAAGTDDLKAVAAAVESVYGDELDGKNIVYVTKQTKFTNEPTNATNYLIDVAQVAATDGYKPADGVISGTVAGGNGVTVTLQNVKAVALNDKAGEKTLKVATTVSNNTDVDFLNWFYGTGYSTVRSGALEADTGSVTFQANASALAETNGMVIGKLVEKLVDEVATETNEVVNELATGTVGYHAAVEEQAGKLVDAGSLKSEDKQNYIDNAMDLYFSQIEAATEMALAGGVFGTSLDINDQVTGAVERRTSLANLNAPRTVGFTPWVDVFGTKNEAKRIYDGTSGYEADIYGAVLGFDYTASCGGTLGVAFNVGQADANSTNISEAKIENDADFYGVSLYAAQTFGDFNVRADFGYTQVKNDLSMAGVTKTWKESQDADMITFGVGTEYLVQAGALNVVPHAGIRMTRIDLDDSKFGGEYEAMTVYQLPLGVTFSGTFEQAGWKVAPMVDLTVVPTFGDKNAEVKFYGGASDVVRAVDSNPIRATLGVEAQKGAWTFGVNYGLTAGSDDRLNNSLNANARYTF